MAVVGSAAELPNSPKVSGGLNQRTYTREFLVKTDDKNTGLLAVINAPGIPILENAFSFGGETDYFAILRHIDAERVSEGAYQWIVKCEYSTPEPNSQNDKSGSTKREQSGEQQNPELVIPEIEVSFERYQEVVYYIYNVNTQALEPCKASNGQIFDPPPMRDASRMIVTITRNEAITANHPGIGLLYMDAVNSDFWFGQPPGTWKCQSISAQRQSKQLAVNGFPTILPYLKATYKFEGRKTWDTLLLDAGAYWIDDAKNFRKVKFITDDGHPRVGALDGFGGKLADGANPVFRTFRFYQRLPYSALALPQQFIDFA